MKIYLDGHIDVPAERMAAVSAALPAHIALTRTETGCLKFEVRPCTEFSGRLLVSEIFADQQAFDAHQTRTRASEWFQVTDGIARNYVIQPGNEKHALKVITSTRGGGLKRCA